MEVKISRYRHTPYYVRAFVSSGEKQYNWAGAKGDKIDTKTIPLEVYEYLTMNSYCFDDGELVVEKDSENFEEVKESIVDKEAYENNTHSKEDIVKILKGNFPKMKKELSENVTVQGEKEFVISVAQEMADDLPKGKIDFLADWMGIEADILFD